MSARALSTKARAMLGFRPQIAGENTRDEPLLVVIFLRGGADGLSLVAPYADDAYYSNRVLTSIPSPSSGVSKKLIDLDGFFGLHPSLAPLYPLYCQGELGFVHACGSGDTTLSHFAASDTVERGLFSNRGDSTGWLSRYLDCSTQTSSSSLRAVSMSALLPASLEGSSCAIALQNINDLLLKNPFKSSTFDVDVLLQRMYSQKDLLGDAATQTLRLMALLRQSPVTQSDTASHYAPDPLSQNLRQIAALSRFDAGLSVACVDQTGYDTHVVQGGTEGILSGCLATLSTAIKAFVTDLGKDKWNNTKIVVMSEFGRRVRENDGGGTDHGHGSVMMVLGGNKVTGGKVHGLWQPLSGAGLDQNGNVRATTDYRNVLLEVIASQIGVGTATSVFPGLARKSVGIVNV
jgi:uncharacterized protein (DUF1501 family)